MARPFFLLVPIILALSACPENVTQEKVAQLHHAKNMCNDEKGYFDEFDLAFAKPDGGRATVAIFRASKLRESHGGYTLPTETLKHNIHKHHKCALPLCKDDKIHLNEFIKEPAGATCTGVLVAKDVVATAKHCRRLIPWHKMRFIFGYTQGVSTISKDQYYKGTPLKLGPNGEDWVLIKLDGEVPSKIAEPVTVASPSIHEDGIHVYSYGHHLGLPRVRSGEEKTRLHQCKDGNLTTNLDRFTHGSGSPVFEADSNKMIGLLVRAEDRDFWGNPDESCCCMTKDSFTVLSKCVNMVISAKYFIDDINKL